MKPAAARSNATLSFYASCPRGLEEALAEEIKRLGATVERRLTAGVRFSGDTALGYRVNLHSRIASRVLQEVAHGPYRTEDDLYRLALATPWERWHDPLASLRVDVTAVGSPLTSLKFAMLRIKDGVVDRIRNATGERPSIDTQRPQREVFGYLDQTHCTVYLDWSGEALFKRGWRRDGGNAPLKENLAAGLLWLAGWTPEQVLLDPFCGAGTIAIEAADIAGGQPAGRARRFAFERMKTFEPATWQKVRAAAAQPARAATIYASDISEAALALTRNNLRAGGVPDGIVHLRQLDALNLQAPRDAGLMLTNPPYGERLDMKGRQSLSTDAERFWLAFSAVLKQRFAGWTACLLTSDTELPRLMRFKETRRTPLYNGPIECRLFRFELYAGSRRSNATIQPTTP